LKVITTLAKTSERRPINGVGGTTIWKDKAGRIGRAGNLSGAKGGQQTRI